MWQKSCSEKFLKIHWKTALPGSVFSKLQVCHFFKRNIDRGRFTRILQNFKNQFFRRPPPPNDFYTVFVAGFGRAVKESTFNPYTAVCPLFFIFAPNHSPSKTEKCFSFHLKSSFHSHGIQIFVISLSTLSRFKRTNESGIIYNMNWRA